MVKYNAVREEVLKLITKNFSPANNRKLKEPPNGEEIERIFLNFLKEKSAGWDGITYDFLQGYWDFVGDCCKKMVLAFWSDAKLSCNIANDI